MTRAAVEKHCGEILYRRSMVTVLSLCALYSLVGIGWGLPNGNTTWAADSVAPMTPFAVAYHSLLENGFNSGYFYFKYPVGHQLVLATLSAPVLVFASLSGHLQGIQSDYPFGFTHPETYLTVLAVLMRLVSAAMAVGIVALLIALGRRFAGSVAGILTGLVALGCYPFVFYAHTSNVEIPYLFWALLGLYALVRAIEERASRWYWVLGLAAAMAVSTKEQIGGFFVLMPLAILLLHGVDTRRAGVPWKVFPPGAISGGIFCLVVFFIVNAGIINPSGIINRLRFLTHTLDPTVRGRYAPYEFPVDMSTQWTSMDEITHGVEVARAASASLGPVVVLLALAGLVILAKTNRRALFYLFVPALGYYATSLRILKQVEIRYVLPLSLLLTIPAAVVLARMWTGSRRLRPVVAVAVVAGLIYSGEILAMLVGDARYRCEQWMEPRLAAGKTVEVYQSWTYLPRWRRTHGVHKPPMDAVTIEGLRERAPDYVAISSKAREGITMVPNPDWRDGRGMMLESPKRRRFLDLLEDERLGYRRTIVFERSKLIPRLLITSLDPSVIVYERVRDAANAP